MNPEIKRSLLHQFYHEQIHETYSHYEDFQSKIRSEQSLDSLKHTALQIRTSERAAIRLGAELSIHLQFMELEVIY